MDLLTQLVHTDGDLHKLTTVLVPHIDAVLARIIHRNTFNSEAGKLATLERDLIVVVRHNFLFILEPGDLRLGVTPYCTCQTQGLKV